MTAAPKLDVSDRGGAIADRFRGPLTALLMQRDAFPADVPLIATFLRRALDEIDPLPAAPIPAPATKRSRGVVHALARIATATCRAIADEVEERP